VLWVADADGLHGFDRRSGEHLEFIDFSDHAPGFLNDVEADAAGVLYLTDTGNARLFRVESGEITVLAAEALESPPNGIVWYSEVDAFVLAPWGDGLDLKAWRPSEGKLVEIGRLPEGGNIDGLEAYDGRLIVASQVDQAIWSWRNGEAVKLFGTPGRPADIGIDSRRGRVAVPYIALDRVELWALPQKE
jgi:sugar lactone lactonase YvrE